MQPASSITPDRRDESYEAATAAVRSKGQHCGAHVLLARLLEGLSASSLVPADSASGSRGATSMLSLSQLDHFEDHVASSSRPSAVYDTEPAQSCGVT